MGLVLLAADERGDRRPQVPPARLPGPPARRTSWAAVSAAELRGRRRGDRGAARLVAPAPPRLRPGRSDRRARWRPLRRSWRGRPGGCSPGGATTPPQSLASFAERRRNLAGAFRPTGGGDSVARMPHSPGRRRDHHRRHPGSGRRDAAGGRRRARLPPWRRPGPPAPGEAGDQRRVAQMPHFVLQKTHSCRPAATAGAAKWPGDGLATWPGICCATGIQPPDNPRVIPTQSQRTVALDD